MSRYARNDHYEGNQMREDTRPEPTWAETWDKKTAQLAYEAARGMREAMAVVCCAGATVGRFSSRAFGTLGQPADACHQSRACSGP
jgi:hypothetical protein